MDRKLEWGNMTALRSAAESLGDQIKTRTAAENRALRGGAAIDAEARDRLIAIPRQSEEDSRALLLSLYKQNVPQEIRDWAAKIPGLASGEVFPRLIGLIGDPVHAVPYHWETPAKGPRQLVAGVPFDRSVSELWQWCGCGDPLIRPKAGMSQEELLACGKRTVVRPVLYNFTAYISRAGRDVTKADSPKLGQPLSRSVADSKYFKTFAHAKEQGLTRVHAAECRNHKRPPAHSDGCGTVANPEWGEIGSPWRPGHAEAHAHRVTAKKLLHDLWVQAGGETPERYQRYRPG